MPFTFSHPALVVPLLYGSRRYKWLSTTGLIIGSMAPDAEKFFRLKLANQHSHTIGSIFYFSCPISLGLAFIFHMLVRRPLIMNLPFALYRRVSKYIDFDWYNHCRQHKLAVLLSIVLGAGLHLFWDAFTHYNTVVTSAIPESANLIQLGNKAMPLWQLVALVSSIIGMVVILYAIWRMPVDTVETVPGTYIINYWSVVALISLCLETGWIIMVHPRWLNIGISSISAMMLSVLIISTYISWRDKNLHVKF